VVQKPESLLTVDPGLATTPPEQLTLTAAPSEGAAAEGPASGRSEPPETNRLVSDAD